MAQNTRITLNMIRGEDVVLRFTVSDADGETVNLSAWDDVRFTLRVSAASSALIEKSVVSGGVSLVGSQEVTANTGRGDITLDSADTLTLAAGTYYYDLLGIDDSSNRDTLILPSKLVLERGITES